MSYLVREATFKWIHPSSKKWLLFSIASRVEPFHKLAFGRILPNDSKSSVKEDMSVFLDEY
jgi:hypothetical protein